MCLLVKKLEMRFITPTSHGTDFRTCKPVDDSPNFSQSRATFFHISANDMDKNRKVVILMGREKP